MKKNKIVICAGIISIIGLLATGCGSMIDAADSGSGGTKNTAAGEGRMDEANQPQTETPQGKDDADQPQTETPQNIQSIFAELAGLEYQQYTCDGLPEYSLTADDGTTYYMNFSEKWVIRKDEQAELPDKIISWLEANKDSVSMEEHHVVGKDTTNPEDSRTISLKIVDGSDDKTLILAGKESHDVYALPVDGIPVYLDGKLADAEALEDGMTADISYDGSVLDTFPAKLGNVDGIYVYSLGSEKNPGGSMYDICGLYLKVLDDLWKEDKGLNGGSKYISVDLSEEPGDLSEGEKSAIAWIFASRHNMEMLTLSYSELEKQGYIKDSCWEDGILFSITAKKVSHKASLPVVMFDAQKWRSGTGAIIFYDCSAVWPEMGTWKDYSVGGHAIS